MLIEQNIKGCEGFSGVPPHTTGSPGFQGEHRGDGDPVDTIEGEAALFHIGFVQGHL